MSVTLGSRMRMAGPQRHLMGADELASILRNVEW